MNYLKELNILHDKQNLNENEIKRKEELEQFSLFNSYVQLHHPRLKVDNIGETISILNGHKEKFFMYPEQNRIFDSETKRPKYKIPFSYNQITQALENGQKNRDTIREKILENILNNINIHKPYNIIISNEGLGKSSLTPKIKEKFRRDRIIIAFKSYDQIYNRKITLLKNNPELTSEVIPSTDRLLNKYSIEERIFEEDKETGDMVLSFRKSVLASTVESNLKTKAIEEKEYFDSVSDGGIEKDIIFITEDKLIHEITHKKRFRNDLIIFDEFNQDCWFNKRIPTEQELSRKKKKPEFFLQPTWNHNFQVKMIKLPTMWYNLINTDFQAIILSTEQKVIEYFNENKNFDCNFIDERIILPTELDKCKINIIKHGLLTQKHKNKLATALRINDYIVVGNGVNSTINNVSALGQNFHDEWENKKIAIFITQPSPEEIAPLMVNLNLDHESATLIKMIDTANQLIGRAQGFRNNVNIKEMQIFLPDKFAYEILPFLRYVTFLENDIKNEFNDSTKLMDKIIHSLNVIILKFEKKEELFLSSLTDRINTTINTLIEYGIGIVEKIPTFKYFRFPELKQFKSKLQQAKYILKQKLLKLKANYKLYSELFSNSNYLLESFNSIKFQTASAKNS